jgi:NAD(P)-dependent dehydrogenase (short-subunit alcohol dehydrogenase family)
LDGLVNNARMSPLTPSLLETSEVLFDKVVGVNLKGPTRLTALGATTMARTGGGSIVNISSLASVKPTPIATVYAAAKAGLNALTTASALEYAGVGVPVNGIICGTFDTDAASGFVRNPGLVGWSGKPHCTRTRWPPRGDLGRGGLFAFRRIELHHRITDDH